MVEWQRLGKAVSHRYLGNDEKLPYSNVGFFLSRPRFVLLYLVRRLARTENTSVSKFESILCILKGAFGG